jgi:glycosyltransferase involved in cell wall biosynthesis
VRVETLRTASSRIARSPDEAESRKLLDLVDRTLGDFRPQAVLTYGGHPTNRALMARARRRGVPVVFHLHNFAYDDRRCFADADAVLVPSEYSRRHYARRLGLDCVAIAPPVVPERVLAVSPEPRYLTFVNPQRDKGAAVFTRIAAELAARRPEIPLLVVEGRAKADGLAGLGLDLSGLRNLHRLPNLSSPRAIYRLSRAVLAPSLVRESFGRVAAEALCNGLPVLSSDRGALPETLGDAGFVFTVPPRCTPQAVEPPTAREVAPWVAAVERLWDDPAFEASHRARALVEARRWSPDVLTDAHAALFESLAREG